MMTTTSQERRRKKKKKKKEKGRRGRGEEGQGETRSHENLWLNANFRRKINISTTNRNAPNFHVRIINSV